MYSLNGLISKNNFVSSITVSFLLVILSCLQLDSLVHYISVYKKLEFTAAALDGLTYNDIVAVIVLSITNEN